jgi:methionyl-tRNA formyltransferase
MHILFLGPACPPIEDCFFEKGHSFARTEETLSLAWIKEQRFDFGLSYRYKKIIRQDVIDYFLVKLINMHISFLPWNRGSDPNLWSYIDNTPKGVTIHRIDGGIDTGDILLQQEVHIDLEKDTLRTSYDKLSQAIECIFIANVDALLDNALAPQKQHDGGSFHRVKDKNIFLSQLEKQRWDTPVRDVCCWAKFIPKEKL